MAFKAILHCHNSTGRVLAKSTRNLSWSIMDGLQSQFIPTEARCRVNTIASTHHRTAKANLFLINSGKIMLCLVPSMSATTKRDLKALSCSIKELVEVCWPLLKHQEARRPHWLARVQRQMYMYLLYNYQYVISKTCLRFPHPLILYKIFWD